MIMYPASVADSSRDRLAFSKIARFFRRRPVATLNDVALILATDYAQTEQYLRYWVRTGKMECIAPVHCPDPSVSPERFAHSIFYRWQAKADGDYSWLEQLRRRSRKRPLATLR